MLFVADNLKRYLSQLNKFDEAAHERTVPWIFDQNHVITTYPLHCLLYDKHLVDYGEQALDYILSVIKWMMQQRVDETVKTNYLSTTRVRRGAILFCN